ncbi:hypothetical protein [Frigidibacter oleivorans]|uniref:hypothetical protein n=1 Tax=Frigidibacter oleivorans TaxID=2487129 RepID=UPI000F8E5541|nr:hypothetical protein [Frigidibacter oleivorans]
MMAGGTLHAPGVLLPLSGGLIHLAPLLAGLAVTPIALLPVFVAAFVLWLALARPRLWALPAGGPMAPVAARLAAKALLQSLLIAAAFGLGRGFAGMAGEPLPVPLWLPVALALAALPMALAGNRRGPDPQVDRLMAEARAEIARREDAAAEAGTPLGGEADRIAAALAGAEAGRDSLGAVLTRLESLIHSSVSDAGDLDREVDELARLPDGDGAYEALARRRGSHPLWDLVLLRFLAHPASRTTRLSNEAVAALAADGLASSAPGRIDESLALAESWLGKTGFETGTGGLRRAATARQAVETDPARAERLRRLVSQLDGTGA